MYGKLKYIAFANITFHSFVIADKVNHSCCLFIIQLFSETKAEDVQVSPGRRLLRFRVEPCQDGVRLVFFYFLSLYVFMDYICLFLISKYSLLIDDTNLLH